MPRDPEAFDMEFEESREAFDDVMETDWLDILAEAYILPGDEEIDEMIRRGDTYRSMYIA
jgi:hypothetical protein